MKLWTLMTIMKEVAIEIMILSANSQSEVAFAKISPMGNAIEIIVDSLTTIQRLKIGGEGITMSG
jgi:hypothetical protein